MSLETLNRALYEEIARLRKASTTNGELDAEVTRAKAMSDLGRTIIETGKLSLDAARFTAEVKGAAAGNVRVPKMLLEDVE